MFFVLFDQYSDYLALKQHVDQLRNKQKNLRSQRDVSIYMLWFNFILGSNFTFLLFVTSGYGNVTNEFKTKENKI